MKKIIVALITMLVLVIPIGAFADEGKAVNTQLTKLELQNDAGETIKEVSIGSSFKLFANYTITDTIHTGDYFDMTISKEINLSSAFTDYNFTLKDNSNQNYNK
jgi:hypothetical protein